MSGDMSQKRSIGRLWWSLIKKRVRCGRAAFDKNGAVDRGYPSTYPKHRSSRGPQLPSGSLHIRLFRRSGFQSMTATPQYFRLVDSQGPIGPGNPLFENTAPLERAVAPLPASPTPRGSRFQRSSIFSHYCSLDTRVIYLYGPAHC